MQQPLPLYVLEQLSDAAQVINKLVVAVFVALSKLLTRVEQSYCKKLQFY